MSPIVHFERNRQGEGVIGHLDNMIVLIDRDKNTGKKFFIKPGSIWKVEIVGSNTHGTVYFVKPVRQMPYKQVSFIASENKMVILKSQKGHAYIYSPTMQPLIIKRTTYKTAKENIRTKIIVRKETQPKILTKSVLYKSKKWSTLREWVACSNWEEIQEKIRETFPNQAKYLDQNS